MLIAAALEQVSNHLHRYISKQHIHIVSSFSLHITTNHLAAATTNKHLEMRSSLMVVKCMYTHCRSSVRDHYEQLTTHYHYISLCQRFQSSSRQSFGCHQRRQQFNPKIDGMFPPDAIIIVNLNCQLFVSFRLRDQKRLISYLITEIINLRFAITWSWRIFKPRGSLKWDPMTD